ncbi:hypothetical protein QQY24_06655 [Streptomyces sp. TG1A-8]|uniref:hypothetical protein n=1 Tax=Streptomyces sp. TG1A-8 TaxID=3051385 RepID=UPI00265B8763|nr:hypothetical protein [Streptomyces sp. TG1A-8]MDO0925116.1 hypothetical protein [Streptomyces sp. TG1A-8]
MDRRVRLAVEVRGEPDGREPATGAFTAQGGRRALRPGRARHPRVGRAGPQGAGRSAPPVPTVAPAALLVPAARAPARVP